jgi:hypothetical protein
MTHVQEHPNHQGRRSIGRAEQETLISSIRSIDLRLVDDLVDFVRGRGFVLDFSDASFSDFFATELQVDIDDPQYAEQGGSKGKRLRCFLQKCDDLCVPKTLFELMP